MKKQSKKSALRDMGFVSNEELLEKHYGKRGTPKREKFETEANIQVIGELFKQARKERNLTQEELADILGIHKGYISRIENNLKKQRIDTLARLAKALNATLSIKLSLKKEKKVFELTV